MNKIKIFLFIGILFTNIIAIQASQSDSDLPSLIKPSQSLSVIGLNLAAQPFTPSQPFIHNQTDLSVMIPNEDSFTPYQTEQDQTNFTPVFDNYAHNPSFSSSNVAASISDQHSSSNSPLSHQSPTASNLSSFNSTQSSNTIRNENISSPMKSRRRQQSSFSYSDEKTQHESLATVITLLTNLRSEMHHGMNIIGSRLTNIEDAVNRLNLRVTNIERTQHIHPQQIAYPPQLIPTQVIQQHPVFVQHPSNQIYPAPAIQNPSISVIPSMPQSHTQNAAMVYFAHPSMPSQAGQLASRQQSSHPILHPIQHVPQTPSTMLPNATTQNQTQPARNPLVKNNHQ